MRDKTLLFGKTLPIKLKPWFIIIMNIIPLLIFYHKYFTNYIQIKSQILIQTEKSSFPSQNPFISKRQKRNLSYLTLSNPESAAFPLRNSLFPRRFLGIRKVSFWETVKAALVDRPFLISKTIKLEFTQVDFRLIQIVQTPGEISQIKCIMSDSET